MTTAPNAYTERTRTVVQPHDRPQLCHACEASIAGPGTPYVVATYRGDRVALCRPCGR